jgi:hypothetical protein
LGRYFCSRVIRVSFEIGEKERLATGFLAAAIWFRRHKYGINLGKRREVVTLQNPAFLLMPATMIIMMLIAKMTMLLLMMMAANSIGRGIYERANASSGPMS